MNWSKTPGTIKKFGRTSWKFQRTFATPLEKLRPFVTTIIKAVPEIKGAHLTIDSVVFEPTDLIELSTKYSVPPHYKRDITLTASGADESDAVLYAALSDWVDFLFAPQPKPFVIYADHDEYTTFYAQTKSNLGLVSHPLLAEGFREIEGFRRHF